MLNALVTLYNPTDDQLANLSLIRRQVDRLIVCDNSCKSNKNQITVDCSYRFFNKNLGLSVAFNMVLKDPLYEWADSDYVIFFDQDSKIDANHISKLVRDYDDCISKGIRVGCISPVFFNTSRGATEIPHDKKRIAEGVFEVKSNITSSMLCKYGVLRDIGYWNEEVFLDMADFELCWRMLNKNYKCLMTSSTSLTHSVGIGDYKIGPLRFRVSSPIREYYKVRDCLYIKKKDYTPLKFKIRFMGILTVKSLIHILFFDNKKERKKYIKRGVLDYKRGIHGEYIE